MIYVCTTVYLSKLSQIVKEEILIVATDFIEILKMQSIYTVLFTKLNQFRGIILMVDNKNDLSAIACSS